MTIPPRSRTPIWLKVILFILFLPLNLFAFIIVAPITILGHTVFRGRCHHCHRRGLTGARVGGDGRPYFWSECGYCHHQFHTLDDRSFIHITPGDSRYVRVT